MEQSKFKKIIKISLDLMLFVQEIISNEKWDIVNPDEYVNIKTH